MANSLREVKGRIDSTKKTAQITKAMYMVSQSKVRRAEKTFKDYQSFMKSISDMTASIVSKASLEFKHDLLVDRPIKKTCFLIISSDKGLAGAYNNGLFKFFEAKIKEDGLKNSDFMVSTIGKRAYNYVKKMRYENHQKEPTYVRDDVMFVDIVNLANQIIKQYLNHEIDRLVIIYNHFINSLSQEIETKVLLPIKEIEGEISESDYIYESGIENTLNKILPMYIQDIIYGIILDAKTAEHAARVNSMRSATDNATDVIDKLQVLYNRSRQEAITNELNDIVGGSNAIGGK
ncbi:MAG: ATP synthase F1 subunit gamma [Acholeplasmatales bacterium]|nr:ATP synthase F1 subunit gamma [Acholeplasmatales bacterium]